MYLLVVSLAVNDQVTLTLMHFFHANQIFLLLNLGDFSFIQRASVEPIKPAAHEGQQSCGQTTLTLHQLIK